MDATGSKGPGDNSVKTSREDLPREPNKPAEKQGDSRTILDTTNLKYKTVCQQLREQSAKQPKQRHPVEPKFTTLSP